MTVTVERPVEARPILGPVTTTSRLARPRTGDVGAYAVILIAVGLVAVPLMWMVFASFKSRDELYRQPLQILPTSLATTNYERALEQVPFTRFFVNSIGTTLIATAVKAVLGVTTAYALVFLRFPGRRLVFWFVVGSLMVPFEVVLIPNYVTVADLGWLNTWAGIIVPGAGVAFGAFLLHQSFRTIPREIVEAADLDGVSRIGLLTRVVVPMSRPAITAFALITAVAKWNEYLWPRLVSTRDVATTLPVGLTLLRDSEGVNEWGPIMAGAVLVVIPVIPLLLLAQRRLVAGLTGGVKG
jgi:sn-glycerol 3-phosphate transport system permease protein